MRHDRENYIDFGQIGPDGRVLNFSALWIGTAGAKVFAHGDTIHWLHLSELSRYPDAQELMTGAQNAVPEGGYICIESTANGMGGKFYDLYTGAKRGENSYKPFFYTWPWKEDYRDDLTPEQRAAFMPSEEEADLIEAMAEQSFELTFEHLAWRRRKKGDDPQKFSEQFPEDDETCFLVSGSRAFDIQLIQRLIMKAMTRVPIREENLGYGWIKVWRGPVEGHVYVLGADSSQGLPTGDWSAGVLMDASSGDHVASMLLKCSTQEFARHLRDLGNAYDEAWIVPERQGYGHAVIADLERMGYDAIYEHDESETWFPCTPGPGIQTTRANKPMMVENFGRALRDETFRTYDVELLGQARAYQRTATAAGHPQFEASDGHDDLLMAAIIANQAAELVPHDKAFKNAKVVTYA